MQLLAFISKSRNYFSWYDVPVDILSYIDLPIKLWILKGSINTKLERLVDEIRYLATTRDENWFLECLKNASLVDEHICIKYPRLVWCLNGFASNIRSHMRLWKMMNINTCVRWRQISLIFLFFLSLSLDLFFFFFISQVWQREMMADITTRCVQHVHYHERRGNVSFVKRALCSTLGNVQIILK